MQTLEKQQDGAYYTPPNIAYALSLRLIFFWFVSFLDQPYTFEQFEKDLKEKQISINLTNSEQRRITEGFQTIQILDPAVGAGSLLFSMLTVLEEFASIIENKSNWKSYNRLDFVETHVTGWDLQEAAINTLQNEMMSWCRGETPNYYQNGKKMKEKEAPLSGFLSNRFKTLNTIFTDTKEEFDLIIANPPYGNLLSIPEKQKVKKLYSCRPSEVVELFLEKGIRLLKQKPHAHLCYIVPKTITYYQQWEKIRRLILNYPIKEIIDLGIAFKEVNLEQIAIIIGGQPIEKNQKENIENALIFLSSGQPLKMVENKLILRNGQIPESLLMKNQILVFAPLTIDHLNMITEIEKNSIWLTQIGNNFPNDPFTSVIKRSIYISDTEKFQLKPGETYFINKVPDITEKGVQKVYKITSPYDILEYLRPKILFKVYRGSRLVSIADPFGNLVTTEKIVNFFLDPKYYQDIWGITAILNTRPPSFYLQSTLFSQTTESSRVMDPFYAKFIPLPTISKAEWIELSLWGKLLILAYSEKMENLSEIIKDIIEFKAIAFYFPGLDPLFTEFSTNFSSQNNKTLSLLFGKAEIEKFDEYYHQIIESRRVELPISKSKPCIENDLSIWDNEQKKEINKLMELLERSLERDILKKTPIYTNLYQFLGK